MSAPAQVGLLPDDETPSPLAVAVELRADARYVLDAGYCAQPTVAVAASALLALCNAVLDGACAGCRTPTPCEGKPA